MEEIFKIREVRIEDIHGLLKVIYQLSHVSEEDKRTRIDDLKQILQEIIEDKNYYICVFEYNGEIIGTGSLLIQKNLSHGGKSYAHIENVVIDVKHEKNGFGKLIIYHLIKIAKYEKCYKVILNCKKHLLNFYSKCGMNETGEIEMRLDLVQINSPHKSL